MSDTPMLETTAPINQRQSEVLTLDERATLGTAACILAKHGRHDASLEAIALLDVSLGIQPPARPVPEGVVEGGGVMTSFNGRDWKYQTLGPSQADQIKDLVERVEALEGRHPELINSRANMLDRRIDAVLRRVELLEEEDPGPSPLPIARDERFRFAAITVDGDQFTPADTETVFVVELNGSRNATTWMDAPTGCELLIENSNGQLVQAIKTKVLC